MHTVCVDKSTRFISHTLKDSALMAILATGMFSYAPMGGFRLARRSSFGALCAHGRDSSAAMFRIPLSMV